MSGQALSRQAQWMLTRVFKDCEPSFAKDRVTLRGVTFLLNDRAISWLNQEAAEARGQFPVGTPAHSRSKS